jgi:hypothetical protein
MMNCGSVRLYGVEFGRQIESGVEGGLWVSKCCQSILQAINGPNKQASVGEKKGDAVQRLGRWQ